MHQPLVVHNSVELPWSKVCDDSDGRKESLPGSCKAGKRVGKQRARGKFNIVLLNIYYLTVKIKLGTESVQYVNQLERLVRYASVVTVNSNDLEL